MTGKQKQTYANSQKTRHRLLEAANQLVLTQGADRLTLAAVAKEAGLSKGALLYHFPTKDALITSMIDQLIQEFETAIETHIDPDLGEQGWLQAYVRTTFDPELSKIKSSSAILAAVANNPALLAPLHERYKAWDERIQNSGLDPARATILRLTADGLWFNELLGLTTLTATQRQEIVAQLILLISSP